MKIFGREPTLILSAISGALGVLVAFGLHGLSAEQAALIIAVVSAVFGVLNAIVVRPFAPAAFTGLVAAAGALLAAYGFNVSQEVVGAVQVALLAVLALFVRVQSTPTADPRPHSDIVG